MQIYISSEVIEALINKYNEIYHVDLMSKTRIRSVVTARNCFYFILKTQYGITYQDIGRIFDKNHATIIHGVRSTRNLLDIGDRDTENIFPKVVDLFREYSLDMHIHINNKNNILDDLNKHLRSVRATDMFTEAQIKRLVNNVWTIPSNEVA